MPKPPKGHLAQGCIWVKDIDRSLALYRDLLGMPLVGVMRNDPPQRNIAALGEPDHMLEIIERRREDGLSNISREEGFGIHHVAVWVEDMDELQTRLTAAGFPFTRAPVRIAENWFGARLKVAWIDDPDGVRVELLEYMGPAQAK